MARRFSLRPLDGILKAEVIAVGILQEELVHAVEGDFGRIELEAVGNQFGVHGRRVAAREEKDDAVAEPACCVFLVVGLGGLWLGNAFLAYPLAYAKPLIVAIELAMTLTVAATLGLLMVGVPERRA